MAENPKAAHPSVALDAQDAKTMAARVVLPAGIDPHTLSVRLLASLARERGVELTSAAEHKLAAIVNRYLADGGPVNEVFIRATAPEHGENGSIEWRPGYNPGAPDEGERDPGDGPVDFYAHRSFVKARREDHVATIHLPTEGTDGRDVTGRTIAANPGKPVGVTLDDTLLKLSDGRVIAQTDGLLCYDGRRMWIDPVLDIKGTVDFSTGNIDFEGDVVIHHDIRDRFMVRATGNVTIEGLIDASHIDCRKCLTARRGVAGRDEGTLEVGGDAHIGYIDRARGNIGGTLYLTREIMHSTISVCGDLVSDLGSIIGGRVSVAGNARVADLGAESDTPTEFRLAAPPDESGAARLAGKQIQLLRRKVAEMQRELEAARATAGPRNPKAAERVTELTFEIGDAEAKIEALAAEHPQLGASASAPGPASTLEVLRAVHGRVTLVIGTRTVSFSSKVKGPLKIWLEGARVVCRLGEGHPQPINTLTGVTDLAAA